MYLKLVLATCVLAFCAVVFSAYARLSAAGLGCDNWPVCYSENAIKQRQQPPPDAARKHESWQWKLQNQVGLLLGILSIAICGYAWQKHNASRHSPLLPTLLVALMAFLAVFGIMAFSYLSRAVIVPVHLAGGFSILMLLTWIALRLTSPIIQISEGEARRWRGYSRLGLLLLLVQIMLGGWVSSNFAALACTDFPLCQGSLFPNMDFFYSPGRFGPPLSLEKLTAIHWMHRVGAVLTLVFLSWLSWRITVVRGLRRIGKFILGLIVFQFLLGVFNVLLGLSLVAAVLHNAVAMLLLSALVVLNYTLTKQDITKQDRQPAG